jgi:hypothetical protein
MTRPKQSKTQLHILYELSTYTDINKQHKTYIALLLLKKEMSYTYFNKYKINSR